VLSTPTIKNPMPSSGFVINKRRSIVFRYPHLLGSLEISNQALWHPYDFLLWAHPRCTNELSLYTICTLGQHIERINLNWGYFGILILVLALLLYVTNLLTSLVIPAISPHKTSFVISKGSLASLGDIAQSLFVERCPLATQAHKQVVLTTIDLSQGVIELFYLLLECPILNH
jgi:hypothetical protein